MAPNVSSRPALFASPSTDNVELLQIGMHFAPFNIWDCMQFCFNESAERGPKKLANPIIRKLDSTRLRYIFPTKEKPLFPELLELGTRVGNRHFRRGGSKFRGSCLYSLQGEFQGTEIPPAGFHPNHASF